MCEQNKRAFSMLPPGRCLRRWHKQGQARFFPHQGRTSQLWKSKPTPQIETWLAELQVNCTVFLFKPDSLSVLRNNVGLAIPGAGYHLLEAISWNFFVFFFFRVLLFALFIKYLWHQACWGTSIGDPPWEKSVTNQPTMKNSPAGSTWWNPWDLWCHDQLGAQFHPEWQWHTWE